jgi:hypothetical protein
MTAYAHLLLAASLARKPAGRLHWIVDQKLAGAYAR